MPSRASYEDVFAIVEPQINAEGIHVWPFDQAFPVDVRFWTVGPESVRMNRHNYFEVLYHCVGHAELEVQDRVLPVSEGDLIVIGSTVYHRLRQNRGMPATFAALYFDPGLIYSDAGPDAAEYLTPFLLQDARFPHVVSHHCGIPKRVFELMHRSRALLPAESPRARLTVKTYLKMALIEVVNHYASYTGTVETFQRQQRALERLHPLFEHLERHYGEPMQVQDAARVCAMSESHFMSFFKRTTGRSFMVYLMQFRIEHAQVLLTGTDEPISEISQRTGFCDQSHFGVVFRRLVGMSPVAWRRQSRKSAR